MPIGGSFGGALGGAQLGNAHGRITIDTSQARAAAGDMQGIGNQIRNAMDRAGQGAKKFADQIKTVRGELLAIGAVAGGISFFGMQSAYQLRNFRILFTQLTGSQEEALALMKQLTTQANEFGLSVTDVFQMAQVLHPVLKNASDELNEWVVRAARLKALDPFKRTQDALRAIQEYIAGQPRSIQYLFNVNPALIEEAKEQFKGLGEQIDYILEKRGVTEDVARASANAWISVKNEVKLLLATGYLPLFEAMQPILFQLTEFLGKIRDANPQLLTFGAALAGVAAIGAPLLVFLSTVITSLAKIKALSIAGTLGKAGVGAAALVGGGFVGLEIAKGIGRGVGGDYGTAVSEQKMGDVWTATKRMVFLALDTLTQAAIVLLTVIRAAAGGVANGFARVLDSLHGFVDGVAGLLQSLGDILPDWADPGLDDWADKLRESKGSLTEWADKLREFGTSDALRADIASMQETRRGLAQIYLRFLGLAEKTEEDTGSKGGGGAGIQGMINSVTEWAIKIAPAAKEATQYYEELRQIESDFRTDTLEATRQYNQQRADIIASYEKQIAREVEDYGLQRLRQAQQLERSIARIRAETVDEEAESVEDTEERIAEIREESNDRIIDIEEAHAARMLKLQRDHRVRLLEAAARLDASALVREQWRFKNQVADMQDDLDRRLEKERENLQERIEQAQEAHQERIENAREADDERIKDMQDALAEQQRIEDEDRKIRQDRIEEDHNEQLGLLFRSHKQRMTAMKREAADEEKVLFSSYAQRMKDLGLHVGAYLNLQQKQQEASITKWKKYWTDFTNAQPGGVSTAVAGTQATSSSPGLVDVLNRMVNAINQQQMGGGGWGNTVIVQPGAVPVTITGVEVKKAEEIADIFTKKLEGIFGLYAQ